MTDLPAVDVVCPDLSGNAVGRALVLADLARDLGRVRIIGPASSDWWMPLRARRDLEVVETGRFSWRAITDTARSISAPVVIAVKPLATSFGSALLTRRNRRVILDIDDPELALLTSDIRGLAATWFRPSGLIPTFLTSRLVDRADGVTVAGSVLQRRYGGVLIPHARDDRCFSLPLTHNRRAAREHLGIPEKGQIAVFVGTVRRHKGVDELGYVARAIQPALLYVVGIPDGKAAPPDVVGVAPVSYETALQWLAAANVVVVPQRPGPIGAAQVPAKLSDALGVGRAVVASDLPPIREVVGEAAILVEPGRAELLAQAVRAVLGDTDRQERLELAARRRFEEYLSFSVVRPRLMDALAGAGAA